MWYHSILTSKSLSSSIEIHACRDVFQIAVIRDDYLVLLCVSETNSNTPRSPQDITNHAQVELALNADEAIVAPQRLDDSVGQRVEKIIVAVILHIPSRQRIGQLNLIDCSNLDSIFPRLVTNCKKTIGVGLGGMGIIITGDDMRFMALSSLESLRALLKPTKEKKKKRLSKINDKKDGFARGMSLRG